MVNDTRFSYLVNHKQLYMYLFELSSHWFHQMNKTSSDFYVWKSPTSQGFQ